MFPGVVQIDLGKAMAGGGFERIGSLNNPPNILLAALQRLETRHEMKGSKIEKYVERMIRKWKNLRQKYSRLDSMKDILFASEDITKTVERDPRDDVKVHYGLIASGNKVIKDAVLRDEINGNLNHHVLCVEMEAAGLMDNFPCLVIRGICDYADSHKNDDWQGYAAATAAAFAKELLSIIPASEVEQMENIKSKELHSSNYYSISIDPYEKTQPSGIEDRQSHDGWPVSSSGEPAQEPVLLARPC